MIFVNYKGFNLNEVVRFRELYQNKFVKFEIVELHEDEIC